MEPLLDVRDLSLTFKTPSGPFTVLSDVSFEVPRGRAVGLVGESGSGKSVTALSILCLLDNVTVSGQLQFDGRSLLTLDEEKMRAVRGREIAMIFQDPAASLNPLMRIVDQVAEPLRVHQKLSRRDALGRAQQWLERVGIADAGERGRAYPHQLSGGLRQRAMIAMALVCGPKLLLADEPTTALDVTIQAQVISLLASLQKDLGMSMLLISHDLGLVAQVCDALVVMYAGQVVEQGPTEQVLRAPRHPYTAGLLASTPALEARVERLREIPGTMPDLHTPPKGCRFYPRCPRAQERCAREVPAFTQGYRCFFPLELGERT